MNTAGLSKLLTHPASVRKSYYRLVDARYVVEIDETAHTVVYSWRYNPKGEFGVLYLSSSPECCWREKLKQVQGNAADLPAQVIGRFDVRLSKCLDLTDPVSLKALAVDTGDLTEPSDFATTQELARQARRIGFEAILAPSAIGAECHSLVVFKDKLVSPGLCTLTADSVKPYP